MRRARFTRILIAILFLILAAANANPANAEDDPIRPKSLAVYYGTPSRVNTGTVNVESAAEVFGQYDVVIFNQGLEEQSHGDHYRTTDIVGILHRDYDTKVFGYLDGVAWKSSWSLTGIPEATWDEHLQMWNDMGVDGIFVDRFGYDWQITRGAQNTMLDAIHNAELDAFVNSWFIDHTFSNMPDTRYPWGNPGGVLSNIRSTDMYMLESFAIIEGDYGACYQLQGDSWLEKADKAFAYQRDFDTEIWTLTTSDQLGAAGIGPSDIEAKLSYAWHATAMYGFDGFGWAEPHFSASGLSRNLMPWRPRPNPNPPDGVGTTFLEDVQHNGDVHIRATDDGRFEVICEDGGRYEATFNSPCSYDINGDGVIDLDDVNAVVLASIYHNAPYDLVFDFNSDGVIDIVDIFEIAMHFGETC